MFGNYQTEIKQYPNNPSYNELDMFILRFLDDMVKNSTREFTINGVTQKAFANCLVSEDFSNINIQDEKNLNGFKYLISLGRDDNDPRNYNGNTLNGVSTIQQTYQIYASVPTQEGSKTQKKILVKLLDSIIQEVTSSYTYQTTINGNLYTCPLSQNWTPPQGKVTIKETINSINYITSVLTILFKITKK